MPSEGPCIIVIERASMALMKLRKIDLRSETYCIYTVVHDLDHDQLQLRDPVRNSVINRTIYIRVQRGLSGEQRAALDLQHYINSALSILSLLLPVVHQHAQILVQ
jgi:hypothetical protein